MRGQDIVDWVKAGLETAEGIRVQLKRIADALEGKRTQDKYTCVRCGLGDSLWKENLCAVRGKVYESGHVAGAAADS